MQFSGNTSTLNVEISDKSGIAVPTAVNYIKSGEKEIENAVTEGITQFNSNATAKTTAYNQNATEKTTAYSENATAKLSAYNENDAAKTTAYDNNAAAKLNAYNENDTVKTAAYNQNVTEKTTAFNANATSKTADFNTNAGDKTIAFDNNASAKTTAFNTNATEKQASVDASATAAAASAATSKQWAVGEPTEPTGNSSKYWAQSAAASASNMANRDLSNLSSDGQMIVDSVNGTISNCVLEIPQNIKVEFSGNTVTVKAGSVLVITNSTYTTATTTVDKSATFSDGKYYLIPTSNGTPTTWMQFSTIGSGSTLPADGSQFTRFFNTSDFQYYLWNNNAWEMWGNHTVAFPIGVIEVSNGVASFAKDSNGNDMIFNGAGFIGHHAVVYPNVKALIPDGFNEDGSLKSVELNNNALRIFELVSGEAPSGASRTVSFHIFSTQLSLYDLLNKDYNNLNGFTSNVRGYIKSENMFYRYTLGVYESAILCRFITYAYDGTTVTDFTIRQPVRLATTEMLDTLQDQVDTNTTAIASKQDTLVSGTNIKTINSTTVLGNGNFALADQSLSNLDSNGQMIIDSQNGTISNCILEIPQNIKLTLENNVLTLKSGTIGIIPGSTYTESTNSSDKTYTIPNTLNDGIYAIFTARNFNILTPQALSKIRSGTETPTEAGNYKFFNVTDRKIYTYDYTNLWHEWSVFYPFCLIEMKSGVASFAKDSNGNDMIFNGAGFIGHHAFVYPNVKALIPNGFNEDGSMKSRSVRTQSLQIIELGTDSNRSLCFAGSENITNTRFLSVKNTSELIQLFIYQYCEETNSVWLWDNNTWDSNKGRLQFITYIYNGTTVTDFTIRQPVRMATVEMLKDKQNKLTFDTAPTSNSTNPVTSGGVYTALAAKADDNAVVHLAENETITGNKTFSGTNTFVTPAVSDNSQKPATTAYVNNKFQVVSALPASPDANTFYFIPES